MFSLHCREGVTGWRCLHSSPFNSRCVSCTRVLSAWRGRRVPPWAFLCGCCVCRAGSMGWSPCGPGRGGGTRRAPASPSAFPQLAPRGPACPISSPKALSSDTNATQALLRFRIQGIPHANGLLGHEGASTDSPGCSGPARQEAMGSGSPCPRRPRAASVRRAGRPHGTVPLAGAPAASDGHLASCWAQTPTPNAVCVDGGRGAVCQCSPSRR